MTDDLTSMGKEEYIKILSCAFSAQNGTACDIPGHCLLSDICKRVGEEFPKVINGYFDNLKLIEDSEKAEPQEVDEVAEDIAEHLTVINFCPECGTEFLSCCKQLLTKQKRVSREDFEYIVHDCHCADGYDACYEALKSWLKELGVEVTNGKEEIPNK